MCLAASSALLCCCFLPLGLGSAEWDDVEMPTQCYACFSALAMISLTVSSYTEQIQPHKSFFFVVIMIFTLSLISQSKVLCKCSALDIDRWFAVGTFQIFKKNVGEVPNSAVKKSSHHIHENRFISMRKCEVRFWGCYKANVWINKNICFTRVLIHRLLPSPFRFRSAER